jgi:hypothetical protein
MGLQLTGEHRFGTRCYETFKFGKWNHMVENLCEREYKVNERFIQLVCHD